MLLKGSAEEWEREYDAASNGIRVKGCHDVGWNGKKGYKHTSGFDTICNRQGLGCTGIWRNQPPTKNSRVRRL